MRMARLRGLSLVARLEYLRRKGVADRVLSSLDEGVRKVLQDLRPQEWYSYEEVDIPLMRAVDELAARGDEKFFIEMGRFTAEHNAKWYLKLFFRFSSPARILRKFPTLWGIFFDTGRLEIETREKSAVVRLVDINTIRLSDLTIQGWGEWALERVGAKNVKIVQTKCRERGDQCTEWTLSWE
jgi:hypothetical protein